MTSRIQNATAPTIMALQAIPARRTQLQDYLPRDGITVWKASGVSIENLTVCDYLAGPGGSHGSQIWWNGGDETGKIGLKGFEGSYLTATSRYDPQSLRDSHLAQYGIYVGNSQGPGSITESYASNMAAAAFYVGVCQRICGTLLSDDHGTNSAVGYLGTNSGGRLVIKDSVFDDNRTGLVAVSLNSDDAPPPQDGRCPGSVSKSCTIIEKNLISQNNNADAPVYGTAPPVGVGIDLDGSQFDTVTGNLLSENGSWGIIANDSVDTLGNLEYARCQGGYPNVPTKGLCTIPARGNLVYSNTFRDDGTFGNIADADVAATALTAGSAAPRNCFYGNHNVSGQFTSVPPGIQRDSVDGAPCNRPGTGGDGAVVRQLTCATLTDACLINGVRYPRRVTIARVPIPVLRSMPEPCLGVPANAFCSS